MRGEREGWPCRRGTTAREQRYQTFGLAAHPVQIPSTANIFMPMSSMTNTSAGHPNKAVTRQFRARVTALNSPYRTRFIALYPPLVLKVTMASSFERLRQYQPCLPSKAASRTPSSPVDWRPLP